MVKGSSESGDYAGAGVKQVNGEYWGLNDLSEIVPVKTNQYAELYAVKLILFDTARFLTTPVNIRSDSMYTINTLTKQCARWKWNNWQGSRGQMVKHAELIKECLDLMKGREVKFLKVKSHVGVYQNELADRLAGAATEIDKVRRNV